MRIARLGTSLRQARLLFKAETGAADLIEVADEKRVDQEVAKGLAVASRPAQHAIESVLGVDGVIQGLETSDDGRTSLRIR